MYSNENVSLTVVWAKHSRPQTPNQHSWQTKDGEAARTTPQLETVPLPRAVGEGGVAEGHGESVRGFKLLVEGASRLGDCAVGVLCAGIASDVCL